MTNELTIRSATNADRAQIEELVFGILRSFDLALDRDGTDKDLSDIESNYLARGGVFEVIENNEGKIVGTVGLYPLDETTIELRKMYFDPSIRGRGLGKQVLKEMIEKAKILGYLRVYLETASVLAQAVHLYESEGFQPVEVKHTPRCDQAYVLELSDE
jgi:putative acetyltransferase